MAFIWMVVGGFIGAAIGDESSGFFGMLAGIAVAYLLHTNNLLRAQLQRLGSQLGNVEVVVRALQLEQRQQRSDDKKPATDIGATPIREPADIAAPAKPALDDPERYGTRPPANVSADAEKTATKVTRAAAALQTGRRQVSVASERRPDFFENLFDRGKRWLTTGNVPVKLGVIVSFFGIAFLLKYAVDNRVINIPIEARYLFVAAAAVVLLVLGWRLKDRQRVYALSLQGGGIGILYLTIFAAFSLHEILPPAFAFFLMVLLTIATGAFAVLQGARALAVLGVVGGFLAPVLVSTGSGNHVALFSYYLVLNAAVLGIAWYKAWRSLNIIGFVFTFGVGTLWGSESYTPEKFWSTEPFLVAHFVFYTAIAVLFAFRQPPKLRGLVDGTLVFGTPAIVFALQSLLVADTEYGLAISAFVMAIFYASLALWLHRSQHSRMPLLAQSFAALGVAFGTVAIPLALDERWTSVSWALEGAALVWIGVRQRGLLAKLTGTLLVFASGVMFLDYGWVHNAGLPVLNGNVLGGVLISVASLFSARLLGTDRHPVELQTIASVSLMLWGVAWWLSTGTVEIVNRAGSANELHLLHGFFALSFVALGYWALQKQWLAARRASLAFLPLLLPLAAAYLVNKGHFLYGWGTVAWPLALAAHVLILRFADRYDQRVLALWHYAGGLLFTLLLGYEAYFQADDANLGEVWRMASLMSVLLGVAVGIRAAQRRLDWPLRTYRPSYSSLAMTVLALQLFALLLYSISDSGDPDPLLYVPLLNPLDFFSVVSLLLAYRVLPAMQSPDDNYSPVRLSWAGLAFVLSTLMVVRAVYHFSALIWDWDVLLDADSVQAALSIYWAILGLGGMILGARRLQRRVWIGGVVLMVLVVLKLFMVDFGNTGTVARIISFIGVGVLLLVVGYFAPAPPRSAMAEQP